MAKQTFDIPAGFRFQGTDGVRGETRPASAIKGCTPQEAFLDRRVITEEFMELYAFVHVDRCMADGQLKPGDTIVVGWDPRDTRGVFNEAVINGVRKAGASALVVGVVPTPLVPLYMLYKRAGGGFMITASHNPRDQNGIKTFFSYRGLKSLPRNDADLTGAILTQDYSSIVQKKLRGKRIFCRTDALEFFMRFSLDPENSWQGSVSFKDIVLVVDPANGSLTGIAAEIFHRAGFGQVVEVNNRLNGDVNLHGGVADLEGHSSIAPEAVRKGAFRKHTALAKLLRLGQKRQNAIRQGKCRVCAAVFDADGDRFYLLEYDPFKDSILVRSGDETAFLQARYLLERDPGRRRDFIYLNTVESDFNAASAAGKLGLKPRVTPVGDKWILSRIAAAFIENRLNVCARQMKNSPANAVSTKQKSAVNRLAREFREIQRRGIFDVRRLEAIETALDKRVPAKSVADVSAFFAVGGEETGHNVTSAWLERETGERVEVFAGNGLKSALNTFSAEAHLIRRGTTPPSRWFRPPFAPGFKQTHYAYYVKKELFCKNSRVWRLVKRQVSAWAGERGMRCRTVAFPEDPDMLYMLLAVQPSGARRPAGATPPEAAVFVRNSGTENKIGVNLRGTNKSAGKLKSLGEQVVRLLFSSMKDPGNPFYRWERDFLRRCRGKCLRGSQIGLERAVAVRLLAEMQKQLLIRADEDGCRLAARGKWYLGIMSHE
ncbi:MAG: hypothetical protein ACE5G9_01245 [Nitrospinales bacterium]